MICSFDKERLHKSFDAIEGIELLGGRTLWYPRDMVFHAVLLASGALVSLSLLILIALNVFAGTVFVSIH